MRVLRRKKKSRSNRQPRAAARGRPPPCAPPPRQAVRGRSTRPATGARQHTARPVKDHSSNHGAQRPTRGVGARCHHAARKRMPAPRLARAWAACPSARAGPATAVRQHRGLEGLTLTQEPYGSTLQSLPRREERPQRNRGRPTPTLRGSPGRRGEPPQEPAGAAMPLTSRSASDPQSPSRGLRGGRKQRHGQSAAAPVPSVCCPLGGSEGFLG